MTSTLFLTAAALLITALSINAFNKRNKQQARKLASAAVLSQGSACVWQMDKEA